MFAGKLSSNLLITRIWVNLNKYMYNIMVGGVHLLLHLLRQYPAPRNDCNNAIPKPETINKTIPYTFQYTFASGCNKLKHCVGRRLWMTMTTFLGLHTMPVPWHLQICLFLQTVSYHCSTRIPSQ